MHYKKVIRLLSAKGGFSLVEVLLILSVIAILAAILISALDMAK